MKKNVYEVRGALFVFSHIILNSCMNSLLKRPLGDMACGHQHTNTVKSVTYSYVQIQNNA